MKVAFISDIHGNAIALDAVLKDIQPKELDRIYVLGDICYRGPEPKRSLDIVRALHTEVIKGNADEWIVRGVREGEVPQQALAGMNKERDWGVEKLEPTDLEYLSGLPTELHVQLSGVTVSAFHATPTSLFDVVLPDAKDEELQSKLIHSTEADIFVYGHIHRPYIRYVGGKVIMNTGSVGLPFDGMAKASYGLIEIDGKNVRTSIERVDYDLEKVIALYKEEDYPNLEMMTNVILNGRL